MKSRKAKKRKKAVTRDLYSAKREFQYHSYHIILNVDIEKNNETTAQMVFFFLFLLLFRNYEVFHVFSVNE